MSTDMSDVVPGVNNLMVVFDPLKWSPKLARERLLTMWKEALPAPLGGRDIEIPVVYGGPGGQDLAELAAAAGLSIDEAVHRHSSATYTVACIGSMPGFPYLSGLPSELARARRATPRMQLPGGSVIIGGAQAGILPSTGPCGWHVLGHTALTLFDARRAEPCLLAPGDRLHFDVLEIQRD